MNLIIDRKDIFQMLATTKAGLKVRYRQSVPGFFWVILHPVILLSAQSVAFKYILKINVDNYFLFLSSGLLPWIFLSLTCEMSSSTLIQGAQLIKSYAINPIVLTGAQFLENLFNFIVAFVLVLSIALANSEQNPVLIVRTLPALFSLAYGVFILSILCALIQVFFRDFKFILTFILQILFFLTPVFYPRDFIPENIAWLLDINPILHWIEAIRMSIIGPVLNRHLLFSLGANVVLTIILNLAWRHKKNDIYRYL